MRYKQIAVSLLVIVILISVSLLNSGCKEESCEEKARRKGGFAGLCDNFLFKNSSIDNEIEAEDICFSFEEIEFSECPAVDVLEVCEPYFCEGCTNEFCVDFNFPEAFIGCQAIDCHTIDCDGVYDIQVDGYPSWTTIIDEEEVHITCQ